MSGTTRGQGTIRVELLLWLFFLTVLIVDIIHVATFLEDFLIK